MSCRDVLPHLQGQTLRVRMWPGCIEKITLGEKEGVTKCVVGRGQKELCGSRTDVAEV